MLLKKKSGSYDCYTLELSMGQVQAVMRALERDHAEPVSDEMLAEFQWYIERVPGVGEEEKDVKAREDGAVETGAETTGDIEGENVPIPMPPTEGGEEGGEAEPPPPPGDEAEGEGEFPGEELPGGPPEEPEGGEPGGKGGAPGREPDNEGELEELPPPPRE